MGRDKDHREARREEIAGRVCREFIMRLYVVIKEVTIKLELIVTDLIVESDVAAPAFLFRKGARELVEVKPGQLTAGRSRRPHSGVVEEKLVYRSETVGTARRSGKYRFASVCRYHTRYYLRVGCSSHCACSYRLCRAQLNVPRARVRAGE